MRIGILVVLASVLAGPFTWAGPLLKAKTPAAKAESKPALRAWEKEAIARMELLQNLELLEKMEIVEDLPVLKGELGGSGAKP
jgi:hypothetical protein